MVTTAFWRATAKGPAEWQLPASELAYTIGRCPSAASVPALYFASYWARIARFWSLPPQQELPIVDRNSMNKDSGPQTSKEISSPLLWRICRNRKSQKACWSLNVFARSRVIEKQWNHYAISALQLLFQQTSSVIQPRFHGPGGAVENSCYFFKGILMYVV